MIDKNKSPQPFQSDRFDISISQKSFDDIKHADSNKFDQNL